MRPTPVPLPFGVPPQPGTGVERLPFRNERDNAEKGHSSQRFYRRIRRDLEPFFRRLEKPFGDRE